MAQKKLEIPRDGAPDSLMMMFAVVVALKSLGGSGTIDEIAERVIENEEISEEAQSYPQPKEHRTKLDYYLGWARTYLKIIGALENSARRVWTLTKLGTEIETLKQVSDLYGEYRTQAAQKNPKQGQKKTTSVGDNKKTPIADELPNKTNNPDNEDWKTTLLDTLKSMESYAFERLCQLLLRESGFIEVNVNPKKGADGGIDGIGVLRVNLVSFKVYFQCKCWTDTSVSSPEIQKFRGALDASVDKALFITTSSFTSSAKEEATVKGKTVIDLIDGDRLCDLLKKNNLGVQTEMVEQVNITPEWFDRFNTK